jgi:ribosomal protein S18 acetylase RimI-like enzyme
MGDSAKAFPACSAHPPQDAIFGMADVDISSLFISNVRSRTLKMQGAHFHCPRNGLFNSRGVFMSGAASSLPAIRVMVPSDLDRIVEIDIKVLGKVRPDYWKMKVELDEKRTQVSRLVAELDGKVVGFIIGYASRWEYGLPEKIGWIDTIGVDPDCQRKGVAKLLVREMAKNLKFMGVDTVCTLVTRLDWKLLKFFQSLGFHEGDVMNLALDI